MVVNAPRWTVEVTDLQGQVYGRPQTYERNFAFPIKSTATAGFRVPLSDKWATPLTNGDALIKIYYGADLLFHGLQTSWERVVDGQGNRSVAVTAQDPSFKFPRMVVNRAPTVQTLTADRGQIVKDLIDVENGYCLTCNTYLQTGVQPYLAGSSVTYGIGAYTKFDQVVDELSTGINGFEWRVMPIEYTAGKIGDWYAEPINGRHLEGDVIFESGMGKNNVAEIRETGDLSGVANVAYHIVDAGPGAPGTPVVQGTNAIAAVERGAYYDVISAPGLESTTLRQELADEHATVRGGYRRLVKMTPVRRLDSRGYRVPQFWRDFDVGDFIQVRATDETGNWLDASMRIWQVQVEPDINGIDTLSLVLEESEA